MKLLLFGATGGTEKLLVEQALASGADVVAYIRNRAKLDIQNGHLELVLGELSDKGAIGRAMNGVDAVIST